MYDLLEVNKDMTDYMPILSPKEEFFISTAVRTSNPT
jgi:hypothetical protein